MSSVYPINKGVGKPIVFRGLKGQYIWWLGGGIVGLLLSFAVLYILGVAMVVCIALVAVCGALLFCKVYRFSKRYGEHGWMKETARRKTPRVLRGGTCRLVNVKQTL